MTSYDKEKRKATRIIHPFAIQCRNTQPPVEGHWDPSITRNISKLGIFFNTSYEYEPGTEVELRINHPHMKNEGKCIAVVVRSFPSKTLPDCFETAVYIINIDDSVKGAFYQSIDFFIAEGNKPE